MKESLSNPDGPEHKETNAWKEKCVFAQNTIRFKNEFLVQLSHDMLNALSVIQGFSGLLGSGGLGPRCLKNSKNLYKAFFPVLKHY